MSWRRRQGVRHVGLYRCVRISRGGVYGSLVWRDICFNSCKSALLATDEYSLY